MSDDEFGSDIDDELMLAASNSFEQKTTPGRNNNIDELCDGLNTSDVEDDTFIQSLTRQGSNLQQRNLFGEVVEDEESQGNGATARAWRLMDHNEPPTHHKIDREAAKTWVYPTNINKREYQFNITKRALLSNLLVALPTGLGKTLIAATVMLNWFRWAPESQIIFLAPTKPLVNQQVDACYNIVGIPRNATCELTGGVRPAERAELWQEKRVFFMTPQTLETDLTSGRCDAKRICLIVFDEAHRASGEYAYNKVLRFIRRFNKSFRVLALTATPGSKIETVQAVIENLGIARTEIRTEESLDIRNYLQERRVDVQAIPLPEELKMISDLMSAALLPIVKKLNQLGGLRYTDPGMLTAFSVHQSRIEWINSRAGQAAHWGVKNTVLSKYAVLGSVAHSYDLLLHHGLRPFESYLEGFINEERKSGKKVVKELLEDKNFQKMQNRTKALLSQPDFVGHPKLDVLTAVILQHFAEAAEKGQTDTRMMVFSNYRVSGEEITKVLKKHHPIVKPTIFVGQATGKSGEGMKQKDQQAVIERFRQGEFNVLVATSIGEEGLDIGEVDYIICYDASASPIRMLQRMGRTGRKRTGDVLVLVTEGREERKWEKAKDNYRWIQGKIAEGKDFTYQEELSPRIIPKDIIPEVNLKNIEISPEDSRPEPARPKNRRKKAPPRKFHMPDGVETGFKTVKALRGSMDKFVSKGQEASDDEEVFEDNDEEAFVEKDGDVWALTSAQEYELRKRYRTISTGESDQVIAMPDVYRYPETIRKLRSTCHVKHGPATKTVVRMMNRIHNINQNAIDKYIKNLNPEDTIFKKTEELSSSLHTKSRPSKEKQPQSRIATTTKSAQRPSLQNITNTDFSSARSKIEKFKHDKQKQFKPPTIKRVGTVSSGSNTNFSVEIIRPIVVDSDNDDDSAASLVDDVLDNSLVNAPSSSNSSDDLPSASQIIARANKRKKGTKPQPPSLPTAVASASASENKPPGWRAKRKSDVENNMRVKRTKTVVESSSDVDSDESIF